MDYNHYTVSYILKKDNEILKFNSEKEACEYLGVAQCTIASCYRSNTMCKGYSIERGEATTHHATNTRLYKIWSAMRERCYRINHMHYENYGGRGIEICEEWKDFVRFKEWAIKNGYDETLTIDRINNDGNYEPNNCRWVTFLEQANNRRSNHIIFVNGIRMTLAECSRLYNIPKSTVRWRVNHSRDVLTGAKIRGDKIEPIDADKHKQMTRLEDVIKESEVDKYA